MGDEPSAMAYSLDEGGNRVEFEVPFPAVDDDDDDDADLAAAAAPRGGSSMLSDWLFAPGVDASKYDPGWVNANISVALAQGIIVDNSYGPGGRFEGIFANAEEHAAHEMQMYGTVDDGGGDELPAGWPPAAPPSPSPAAAPAAPPPPAAFSASGQGGAPFADFMAELTSRNPENSGRWTASQAATFDSDQAFFDETGVNAASAAADRAAQAMSSGPTFSADQLAASVQASADVGHAQIDADATRNRYQQTIGFDGGDAAARHASLDAATAETVAQITQNPTDFGVGMTSEEALAAADAKDYAARTGIQVASLTDEQMAELGRLRDADTRQAEADYAAYQASPEGQAAAAAAARGELLADAQAERFAQSRARADEVMQTPLDQR